MASVKCPFCREEFGCRHLIGEGDDQIIWQWDVINTLRSLCEDADLMKIDIGKLATRPLHPLMWIGVLVVLIVIALVNGCGV
jgi:hypothetical protein